MPNNPEQISNGMNRFLASMFKHWEAINAPAWQDPKSVKTSANGSRNILTLIKLSRKAKMKEEYSVLDIIKFAIDVITLCLFFTFIVHSCKSNDTKKHSTEIEGYEVIHYTKSCIDNKQFIKYRRGITINLDMDGKPIPCNF